MLDKTSVAERFKSIQDSICSGLENLDGKSSFKEDLWNRDGGGGGRTRIIQNGDLIEKGGVNFSAVQGVLPDNIKQALNVNSAEFFATGVSIVLHPKSPLVPIIHMNIRYFEMDENTWWFGGGIDLTPHYVIKEKAKDFHSGLKSICDNYNIDFYPKFKTWADDYFFIKHRNETRGVGGIFFDRLTPKNTALNEQELFDFVASVGNGFVDLYTQQTEKRNDSISETQKEWQKIRRGRYVEFNLVYDKGTKFGLDTSGRIESILMSLPKDVSWHYNHSPIVGSEEEKTLSLLKKEIDWVSA